MSSIRSSLDELKGEDLRFLGDEELEDDLLELEQAASVLLAERLRRLAEIERRRTYLRDGYLSGSVWLAQRTGTSPSDAKQSVRLARAVADMPATSAALAEGDIAPSAVRVLVEAREGNREEFPSIEETLVDCARTLSFRELRAVVAHWQQAADPAGAADREERIHELRRLYVSPTLDGMVRIDGSLDPELGSAVLAAVDAAVDANARGTSDMRTSAQRRADALGEICRQWLDRSDRPEVAGERPHVTLTVDLEALEGRAGRTEMVHVGPVTPETARRLACDASISRVITRGRTEPLEVGRRTATVPAALRRAVTVRDGGCRFPGCDRPQSWCDAHHIVHWADGGETNLANLVLLCRPHHRSVHSGGFSIDQELRFHRPDGSILEDRAPP